MKSVKNRINQTEAILLFIGISYALLGIMRATGFILTESNLIALLTIGGGMLSLSDTLNALSEDSRIKAKWLQTLTYNMSLLAMGISILYIIFMPIYYFSNPTGDFVTLGDGITLISISIIFFSFVIKNNVMNAKTMQVENLIAESGEFKEALTIPVGEDKFKKEN